MLTDEELRGIRNQIENQDPYMESADLAAKFLQAINELLSLKSLPAMAEVDALIQDAEKSSEEIEQDLADLARRAITSAESQRKRAEEAEVRLSGAWNLVINNEAFDRCVSTLKTLYGIAAEHAASSETKNAARDLLEVCGMAEKMRDGCVSRDAQLAERDAEIKQLKGDHEIDPVSAVELLRVKDQQIADLTRERDELLQRNLDAVAYKVSLERHAREVETDRDEYLRLLKSLSTEKIDGLSVRAFLESKAHYGDPDATRIIELCERGGSNGK